MDSKALMRQTGLLILMAVGALAALMYSNDPEGLPVTAALKGESISVSLIVHAGNDTLLNTTVEGAAPISALLALEMGAGQNLLILGIRKYDFGRLVGTIGRYAAGSDGDWTYRVNGEFQTTGADQRALRAGDIVSWSFGVTAEEGQ